MPEIPTELPQTLQEGPQPELIPGIIRRGRQKHADPSHAFALLRARRERPGRRRTADERYELAAFQLMEVHSKPASQVGWQDSEGAANSQWVSERPYNLFAGACAWRQTTNR